MQVEDIITGKRKEAPNQRGKPSLKLFSMCPNCIHAEILSSLELLQSKKEELLLHLPDEGKEKFGKEIEQYGSMKKKLKRYEIKKTDLAPFYVRCGEILSEYQSVEYIANQEEIFNVVRKIEWAKELAEEKKEKIHRRVDSSGKRQINRSFHQAYVPSNQMRALCCLLTQFGVL